MHPTSLRACRRVSALLGALVLLVAAACGGSESTDPSTTRVPDVTTTTIGEVVESSTTVTVDPIVIGLVAPSAVDDASFTQSMVDSLDRLAADRLAAGRPLEIEVAAGLSSPDDALPAAEAFAAGGADVVIVHGSQFRSVVERVATDHPDVALAWGTAADDVGLSNVFSYSAAADQGGYVNGVIAAGLTTSGMVGAIGPIQLGDAGLYVDGFQAGALAADPAVQVSIAFLDSYADTLLAQEAAAVMTGFGADVLTTTSQVSVGTLEHARLLSVPYLATQSSPIESARSITVAAQVYHWDVPLAAMIDTVEAGGPGVALEPLTLANGGLTIEFNDGYDLPDDVAAAANAAIAGLTDGSLETGLG